MDLYIIVSQDSPPVRGKDTLAHRVQFTLRFRPKLSLAAHRRLAEKMAQRWRRLTRMQHGVASSGMGGLRFRKEAPASRIQAYKRLARSIGLVPTLYDSTHSIYLRVSTDAGPWAYFDTAVEQEVTATRRLLEALFQRYPKIPDAPTR